MSIVHDEDDLRFERLMAGADPKAGDRAAASRRGLLAVGVVYYGQGAGGAGSIVLFGREISAPHGWYRPGPLAPPSSDPDAAWEAAYAALKGSFSAQRRGLTRAIALAPDRPVFLILRGLCHLVSDNGLHPRLDPGAVADIEKAAAIGRSSHWAPMSLGLVEYLGKNMCRARVLFDEAARRAPRDPWPVILAADALYYNSSFPEASARFEAAVRSDPRCAWAWALLGRSYYLQGDPRMLAALDRAVKLEPRSGWILTWRGAARALRRDVPGARRDFRRGAELAPRYDRSQTWYGAWQCALGESTEGLRRLRAGARLNSFYEVNWYAQAAALVRRGRWAAAKRAMARAIELNLETTWVRGWTDTQDADPACERVLEDLRALLKKYPRWGTGRAWFGQTALLLRRYDEARPALADARAARALGPWPSVWLGVIERRLGRCRAAEFFFGEACKRAPECAWAHAGLGATRMDTGQSRRALRSLDRGLALDLRVGRGLGLLWRACVRKELGLDAQAEEDARRALQFYPHWEHWLRPLLRGASRPVQLISDAPDSGEPAHYDAAAFLRRARRRLKAGDAASARDDLSLVLEEPLSPLCAEAFALRSLAHSMLGDDEDCVRDLARARRLAPELAALGAAA